MERVIQSATPGPVLPAEGVLNPVIDWHLISIRRCEHSLRRASGRLEEGGSPNDYLEDDGLGVRRPEDIEPFAQRPLSRTVREVASTAGTSLLWSVSSLQGCRDIGTFLDGGVRDVCKRIQNSGFSLQSPATADGPVLSSSVEDSLRLLGDLGRALAAVDKRMGPRDNSDARWMCGWLARISGRVRGTKGLVLGMIADPNSPAEPCGAVRIPRRSDTACCGIDAALTRQGDPWFDDDPYAGPVLKLPSGAVYGANTAVLSRTRTLVTEVWTAAHRTVGTCRSEGADAVDGALKKLDRVVDKSVDNLEGILRMMTASAESDNPRVSCSCR